MRLTVVGCSGSFPGPTSPASCYLVEAEHDRRTYRVLLDLGSGALGRLQDFTDPLAVDAVLLSHLHPDHWFDMSGYFVMRKYHPDGTPPRIPVYGPHGVAKRMAQAYGLAPKPGMSEVFDIREYGGATVPSVGPLRFTVTRVAHPVETYAVRVTDGDTSLVYSADTGPCEALVELSRGADLLLAEAAFREGEDNPPDLHLTGRQAGEAAARAGVDRLVLTHIPPWYDPQAALDEARPVFDGKIDLAVSGARFDL